MRKETIEKVWGTEEVVVNDLEAGYCGKVLRIRPGKQSSLHYHKVKVETFLAIAGQPCIEIHLLDMKITRAMVPGMQSETAEIPLARRTGSLPQGEKRQSSSSFQHSILRLMS